MKPLDLFMMITCNNCRVDKREGVVVYKRIIQHKIQPLICLLLPIHLQCSQVDRFKVFKTNSGFKSIKDVTFGLRVLFSRFLYWMTKRHVWIR